MNPCSLVSFPSSVSPFHIHVDMITDAGGHKGTKNWGERKQIDLPGRQRAAACLFLDLQQQQRMLKIWMLWLPIADMMAALSFTNRPTDVKSAQERGAKDKRSWTSWDCTEEAWDSVRVSRDYRPQCSKLSRQGILLVWWLHEVTLCWAAECEWQKRLAEMQDQIWLICEEASHISTIWATQVL